MWSIWSAGERALISGLAGWLASWGTPPAPARRIRSPGSSWTGRAPREGSSAPSVAKRARPPAAEQKRLTQAALWREPVAAEQSVARRAPPAEMRPVGKRHPPPAPARTRHPPTTTRRVRRQHPPTTTRPVRRQHPPPGTRRERMQGPPEREQPTTGWHSRLAVRAAMRWQLPTHREPQGRTRPPVRPHPGLSPIRMPRVRHVPAKERRKAPLAGRKPAERQGLRWNPVPPGRQEPVRKPPAQQSPAPPSRQGRAVSRIPPMTRRPPWRHEPAVG
ncbi:hypothetical protein J2S41_006829 [Catenuloplanes atrovinosus]|uniref:Uncharacterized protein n=1 Tax=Catenuloplanes atrovinosus TaxID=137266 RepID=A0AAE3YWT1_9ACTN|nr:hypothetical protein [Catenuloplanes atrovinosus]